MITQLGIITLILTAILGVWIGRLISDRRPKWLFQRFPNLLLEDKKITKVLNNPRLLVEKLKQHGEIYSEGNRLDIKVGIDHDTGKEVMVVEEITSKKAKSIQKKANKGNIQSKKKVIKKGQKKKGNKK